MFIRDHVSKVGMTGELFVNHHPSGVIVLRREPDPPGGILRADAPSTFAIGTFDRANQRIVLSSASSEGTSGRIAVGLLASEALVLLCKGSALGLERSTCTIREVATAAPASLLATCELDQGAA